MCKPIDLAKKGDEEACPKYSILVRCRVVGEQNLNKKRSTHVKLIKMVHLNSDWHL